MSEIVPSCDFCEKVGLPILPVRYAIAPQTARAPRLGSPMAVTDLPPPAASGAQAADSLALAAGNVHYTTRLLRSGYLYVFDEARRRWDGYFVTDYGYLLRFDLKQGLTAAEAKAREPCSLKGHPEIAGCITVSSPKQATRVWLAYSDVEWTEAVLKRHESDDWRKRHMQVFDVKAWLAGGKAEHARPIKDIADCVSEFAPAVRAMEFNFSGVRWARDRKPDALVAIADERLPGKGAILALYDPPGVAMELAGLMTMRLRDWNAVADRTRPLAVSNAIVSMQAAIRKQAENAEIEASTALARDAESGLHHTYSPGWMPGQPLRPDPELANRYRNVTAAQLDRAMDNAWTKYDIKYDEKARKKWQADYDVALKSFDEEAIIPLALAHTAWMKSTRSASYFECCFDPANAECGATYTHTLTLCLEGTQDKKVCFDLQSDWLRGSLTDKQDLLLRALTLNLDTTAAEIASATSAGVSWETLPWPALIDDFAKATDKALAGRPDVLGRLLLAISGPLAKHLREAAEGPVRQGLLALGVITRAPIVRIEFTGTQRQFQTYVVRELARLAGDPKPAWGIKAAVERELKRLAIRGVPLDGAPTTVRFLVLLDPAALDQATAMPRGNRTVELARSRALAGGLLSIQDLEALELSALRGQLLRASEAGKRAAPLLFGIVGGLMQMVAINAMQDSAAKAMTHQSADAHQRLFTGWAAMAGMFSELTGKAIERIPPARLPYGRGLAGIASKVLAGAGRFAGVFAGLAMAWLDAMSASSEFSEGNDGVGWLYTVSALSGIGALAALAVGWTGIGLILIGLLFAATIFIDLFKDNKLQDWLERCLWGAFHTDVRNKDQCYTDLEVEMQQLDIARRP